MTGSRPTAMTKPVASRGALTLIANNCWPRLKPGILQYRPASAGGRHANEGRVRGVVPAIPRSRAPFPRRQGG
jgi:hypothetical protein